MKSKTYCSLIAIVFSTGLKAQDMYTIKGIVTPAPKNQTMHLYYYKPGTMELQHDSTKVVDGTYTFQGEAKPKTLAFLTIPPDGASMGAYVAANYSLPKEQIGVYLEQGTTNIVLKDRMVQEVQVKGTPQNDAIGVAAPLVWKYKSLEEKISKKLVAAGNDVAKREAATQEYSIMQKNRTREIGAFIKSHPSALTSLDLLKRWIDPVSDVSSAKEFYGSLSPELKEATSAKRYLETVSAADKLSVGTMLPHFELPDADGKQHSLADFKGKYVLVDFWASWCVPCRLQNPSIVKAYDKFKSRNFEIIGVSMDGGKTQSKQEWLDAVAKDGLKWLQVSDLMAMSSPVANKFQITAIPMNFLVNPDGKIIAKNLSGTELSEILEKTL